MDNFIKDKYNNVFEKLDTLMENHLNGIPPVEHTEAEKRLMINELLIKDRKMSEELSKNRNTLLSNLSEFYQKIIFNIKYTATGKLALQYSVGSVGVVLVTSVILIIYLGQWESSDFSSGIKPQELDKIAYLTETKRSLAASVDIIYSDRGSNGNSVSNTIANERVPLIFSIIEDNLLYYNLAIDTKSPTSITTVWFKNYVEKKAIVSRLIFTLNKESKKIDIYLDTENAADEQKEINTDKLINSIIEATGKRFR